MTYNYDYSEDVDWCSDTMKNPILWTSMRTFDCLDMTKWHY